MRVESLGTRSIELMRFAPYLVATCTIYNTVSVRRVCVYIVSIRSYMLPFRLRRLDALLSEPRYCIVPNSRDTEFPRIRFREYFAQLRLRSWSVCTHKDAAGIFASIDFAVRIKSAKSAKMMLRENLAYTAGSNSDLDYYT